MNNSISTRQVAISIETTGLSPTEGHRVIEIAAVELVDRRITGRSFYHYVNPKRDIDLGAQAVHGITEEVLEDKPVFGEIAHEFIDFVRGAELLVHNAAFNVEFLNGELGLLELEYLNDLSTNIVDTLAIARTLRPSQKNTLEVLCDDLEIDIAREKLFGGLLDATRVARVYLAISPQLLH